MPKSMLLDPPPALRVIPDTVADLDALCTDVWERFFEARPFVEQIREKIRTLTQAIMETERNNPSTGAELRFWHRTSRRGDHLIWTGMGGSNPSCDWTVNGQRYRTTPARIAWLLLRGQQIPMDAHVWRTCSEPRCILPEHNPIRTEGSERPSITRIRKDVLPDGRGGWVHARCGSPITSQVRPGQRVYCSVCYQADKRLLAATEAARLAAQRGEATPFIPDLKLPIALFSDIPPEEPDQPPEEPRVLSREEGFRKMAELFDK